MHVDRTSCPWLIRRLIDPQAEFVYVDPTVDPATLDGHSFDLRGAEYSREGDQCTFQVMVKPHGLDSYPALVELGRSFATRMCPQVGPVGRSPPD